jgi:Na+/melibiose symporter-like transporter
MQQTADGDFILHPNQKNSVTNNVITFTRKITIAIAVPVFPSPLVLLGGIKRRYQNAQSIEQSGWW